MARDAVRDIEIERIGWADVERLAPLWESLRQHHVGVVPELPPQPPQRSWEIRRALYEQVLREPDAFVLVAVEEGLDVGYALVAVHDGPDDTWVTGDRIAEVETLAVLPQARGRGVGTALLDRVDAELDRIGVRDLRIAVVPSNADALRFYERRGLRPFLTVLGRFPDA
jgi:ribosomal protein S18 acetylase RimI-like enzyme